MNLLRNGIRLAGVIVCCVFAQTAMAQTIDDSASCRGIGGSWIAANPPQRENRPAQRYGRCSLRSAYTVPANTTLRVEIGVELAVSYGGHLSNNGYIELPNTAALIVVGGNFYNNGRLYADNSGEVWFFLGYFANYGDMEIEGDLFTEPLSTPQPQSIAACLDNRGTIRMISGGNVHNRGCIDSLLGGGSFDLDATATLHNHAEPQYQGHYRTGPDDVFSGAVNNDENAYLEVAGRATVTAGAHIENRGRISITGGILRMDNGATMVTRRSGALTLTGGDFRLDGVYTSTGGVTDAVVGHGSTGQDNMTLGASGKFLVEAGSKVWANGNVNIDNNGLILLDCIVFWYPPMSFSGNSLFLKTCVGGTIKPPRTLF